MFDQVFVKRLVNALTALLAVASSRAADTRGLPERLELGGHHRIRYETLDGQFRSAYAGNDRMLALRTALRADVDLDDVAFTVEILDARQYLADESTPLDTGMVDTIELLQAHAAFELGGIRLLAGRQTLDVGGRRLVARNRFRNTINAFTGLNGSWTAPTGAELRAFLVLPVQRRPSDRESLLDNAAELDRESWDVSFWGGYAAFPDVVAGAAGELYLFGLHESDGPARPTRDRRLLTAGGRLDRKPSPGRWDFELEAVLQTGRSRASSAAADVTDLDHAAHFLHAAAGHTFDRPWTPRLLVQFDLASGDADPGDGENNRFDTLFGARRFEYGPTGIYGAFARSNVVSPGYRLVLRPHEDVEVMAAHRFYWLASAKDAWTTADVRDASGASGRHVGHQAEVRARWDARPGSLRVEGGAARLFAGAFLERAPNANGEGDAFYAYLQSVLIF
jgi:hypothetical protein